MTTFTSEQLNFFKFSTVVLDEFPVALRQVFVYLWDNQVGPTPGFQKWDDSLLVRKMFLKKEGGKTKYVPTSKSFKEWDCTALFAATLYAQSFAMPDGKGGFATLGKLYVKPPGGAFHHSVISPSGNQAETFALALDQLRLLRNSLCHQISTQKINKPTFDHYILLAKGAFAALGQTSKTIDDVGKLGAKDFPTARLQQLEEELRKEKFKQIEDNLDQIQTAVTDVKTKVEEVGLDVKTTITDVKTKVEEVGADVQTAVTDVKTKVEEVGSAVQTTVADVKTKMEEVGADVQTTVADVKTKMEEVGSDVQTAVTDVKTKVEEVGSGVQTAVTDVKTKVEEVGADVQTTVADVKTKVEEVGADVQTTVADVKTKMEEVGSDVQTAVTDVKTKVEEVGSGVQTAVTDVKTKVKEVGSDVQMAVTDVKTKVKEVGADVQTAAADVKRIVEEIGSGVQTAVTDMKSKVEEVGSDVQTAVTDVKTKVEEVGSGVQTAVTDVEQVRSDLRKVKANIDDIKQAMQTRISKGKGSYVKVSAML